MTDPGHLLAGFIKQLHDSSQSCLFCDIRQGMKKFPYYLLLVALYPGVSLFALNIGEANLIDLFRPLVISLFLAGILFLFTWLIFRNITRAAVVSSVIYLVFGSYGALYTVARTWQIGPVAIGRHRVLILAILALLALIIWAIRRAGKEPLGSVNQVCNVFAIVLFAFPVITIISQRASLRLPAQTKVAEVSAVKQTPANPDVYYIILDSYARADYLEKEIHYDNSQFLEQLHQRGFYTVDCGQSNYSYTRLSLATSLNMDYIENLGQIYTSTNTDKTSIDPLILDNRVAREFRAHGYQTVAMETGFPFTEITGSDFYYPMDSSVLNKPYITAFEEMMINNTVVSLALESTDIRSMLGLNFTHYERWLRQHMLIEKIQEIPEIPGPTFTFVHMLTAHRPYVFTADGSIQTNRKFYSVDGQPANEEYFVNGYRNGLDFTNDYILDVVDTLMVESETPPIIILQGDHGLRSPARDSILNAIYIPEGSEQLYATMTPVNTFRVILNHLFAANLPLLEDHSYSAVANETPFVFENVEDPYSCQNP